MNEYTNMFSPLNIGRVQIKNRVVMPAMCLGHGQFDGTPTEQLMDYYEERAKGGAGLIIPGITRVDDMAGLGHLAQLSVSQDYTIKPMAEFVRRIHRHGAKIFIQLHHPGFQNVNLLVGLGPLAITGARYIPGFKKAFYRAAPLAKKLSEKGWSLSSVGPSKVESCDYNNARNRALSKKEIKKIITQFVEGANRAKLAGADGIELHAAHGYLLNNFLSPRTNCRTDEYGGSFENRIRILKDIIEGIRQKCGPDFPVSVRISVTEGYESVGLKGKENQGYGLSTGVRIAKTLESYGIDAINVSSGTYETMNYLVEPVTFEQGWRADFARAVKEAVSIPVISASLIKEP
ncbi:NADH:flavin oxidoreductase [Vibrio bivalvicida]|uniref:NADH:flavin oxidoreductase n=1 Tax=Vibrio bivalvicida TaxID=1276888 RepID=A0ABV4MI57_9VIBR